MKRIPLSHSRIETYEQCPFKFHEKYIGKKKEPYTTPLAFGSAVHLGIEKILKRALRPDEESIRAFMTTQVEKNPYLLDKSHIDEGTKMILRGLENVLVDSPDLWNTEILAEKKFSFNWDWEPVTWLAKDVFFRGVVDVYRKSGNTLYLVDWKTSRSVNPSKNQAMIYAMIGYMVEEGLTNVQTIFDYVRLGEQDEAFFKPSVMKEAQDWLHEISDTIQSDTTWEARPNDFCGYCGFKNQCKTFKDTVTDVLEENVTVDSVHHLDNLELYKLLQQSKAVAAAAENEFSSRLEVNDIDLGNGYSYTLKEQERSEVPIDSAVLLMEAGVNKEDIIRHTKLSVSSVRKILDTVDDLDKRNKLRSKLISRRISYVKTKTLSQ